MQNKVLNDFPGNWPSLPVAFYSPEVLMNIAARGGGCGDCLGLMLYSMFATPSRDSICPIHS